MKRVRMLVLCGLVVILFASVAAAAQIGEAPMLAERVAKGELPPVEERIPQEPFVEHPLEEIGRYGGSIRRVYIGVSDWQNLNYMGVRNEPLVFVGQDGTVKPNLLEGW
jgi:peptide/nickel transport system substrate-binding protein